jgi:hypothetical protein
VQGLTTRDNDPYRYRTIRMQSFEVLQITIEKWVFVIPLYFECNRTGVEFSDVVYLVRDRLAFFAINDLLNDEFRLGPI